MLRTRTFRRSSALAALALAATAAVAEAPAEQRTFAERKAAYTENLRAQGTLMARLETCIAGARDEAAVADCHKTHLAQMQELFKRTPLPTAMGAPDSPLRKK